MKEDLSQFSRKRERMGKATKWMSVVRKKFLIIRPHPQETRIVLHTNHTQQRSSSNTHHHNNTFPINNNNTIISGELKEAVPQPHVQGSNERDQLMAAAAIKIQTFFRSHLARRAFRALRSLVKLQALVRGVLVRRQARMAIHCMHALARLHITVRTRQIFT